MAENTHYTYYSNGYVAEYVSNSSQVCQSWLLVPAENLWSSGLRAFLYIVGMIYLFIGVAIGSDVFMTSIEVITSKKRRIAYYNHERGQYEFREVFVWNETVANLTLLALGSSAPEILLATIEAVTEILNEPGEPRQSLGFYTIMGSAAFNLLVITAICIMSVPSPEVKQLRELGVFILTAIWSLLAYVWLLAVIMWSSPGEIEIWEAVVTLIFFPLLVMTAYAQDNNWWNQKWPWRRKKVSQDNNTAADTANGAAVQMQDYPGAVHKRLSFHSSSAEHDGRTNNYNLDHLMIKEEHGDEYQPHEAPKPMTGIKPPAPVDTELKMMSPHMSYQRKPFARARFRHAAIKALSGAGYNAINNFAEKPTQEPQIVTIVNSVVNNTKLYSENSSIKMNTSASLSFSSSAYSIMENAGELNVDVLLHRRGRSKRSIRSSSDANGNAGSDAITVEYETREGSAKANRDFKFVSGVLAFDDSTFVNQISVPIINDDQYNPDTDFYIFLKNPIGDVCLGDPSLCHVTIIDDDKPGDFRLKESQVYANMETGVAEVTVIRENGSDGNVSVDYATVNGTANGGDKLEEGMDYISTSGTIFFKHNELSKNVKLFVNNDVKVSKNFVIVLRNPSQGSHLGDNSASVVNLNERAGVMGPGYVVGPDEDESWIGQIRGAMSFGRDFDEHGEPIIPGTFEYILHFLAFMWKIIFALVPPKTYLGGYPSFFISLALIGAITAVIEQLGTLLGCAVSLRNAITGVTFIALGTSVPDTFASRTAAIHHDCADASIGNITGSNSVNVFLGLGLPWLIRSIYAKVNNERYIIDNKGIDFAVILFDSFGAVCIGLLLFRRWCLGGELGGTFISKCISSGFLVILWIIYVSLVSWYS